MTDWSHEYPCMVRGCDDTGVQWRPLCDDHWSTVAEGVRDRVESAHDP